MNKRIAIFSMFIMMMMIIILSGGVSSSSSQTGNSMEPTIVSIKGRIVNVTLEEIVKHGVRICVDRNDTFYVNSDGSFEIYDLTPGTHYIDVFSIHYTFPQIRVDISSKSPHYARAYRLIPHATNMQTLEDLNYIKEPISLSPQLRLSPLSRTEYFERRESFNVLSLLKNPMVLMFLFAIGSTYLFQMIDPKTLKEAQETINQGESELKNFVAKRGTQQQQ
jgi:hypothetical protein